MTHTPGPWRVIEKVGLAIYPEKESSESWLYIAFMNMGRENSEANANLMAAAPEMLEALELVQRYWSAHPNLDYEIDAYEAVECVIAKAKGEQQ